MRDLKLSPQEEEAVGVYNNRIRLEQIDTSPLWVDRFSATVFAWLPEDGEVVDVGCGTGRFIQILGDLSVTRYFGIDPSYENIGYCRAQHPQHRFELGSVQTMGERYPDRFDGFIVATSLMHVPRTAFRIALRSLRTSLKHGAHGLISLPTGPVLTWRHEHGVTITLYTEAEIERQLPAHGLMIEDVRLSRNMLLVHARAA